MNAFKIILLSTILAALLADPGIARSGANDPVPEDICQQVADVLRTTPGTRTEIRQGEFRDELQNILRPGCRVILRGSLAALGEKSMPIEVLRSKDLPVFKNWADDYSYGADGPDGTMFAFRGKNTLCVITGRWDGGDDSDPKYFPADWYEIKITCFPGTTG